MGLGLFLTKYNFLSVSGQARAVLRHRPSVSCTESALLNEDLFVYSVFKLYPCSLAQPSHSSLPGSVLVLGGEGSQAFRPVLWPLDCGLFLSTLGASVHSVVK